MANCINTNSVEYKELLGQSKLNPLILKARISIFQDQNGLDSYPKVEDVLNSNDIIEIKEDENPFTIDSQTKSLFTESPKETKDIGDTFKILFNNRSGQVTVDEVLDNISNNITDLNKHTLEFIKRSKKLIGKSGATIKFVAESTLVNKDTIMQYDPSRNIIHISKARLQKYNSKEAVIAFLHEVVHGQTTNILNKDKKDRNLLEQELVDLVKQFVKKGKESKYSKEYGFTDDSEFISEFYANPEFRDLVKRESESLYQKLVNLIRQLFNLPKTTEYQRLFELVISFTEQDQTSFKGLQGDFKRFFESRVQIDSKYASLTNKLDNLLIKAKKKIEEVQKKSIQANKGTKATEARSKHIERNKELLESLERYSKMDKWKGVLSYAKSFKNTIDHVETLLNTLMVTKNIYDDDLAKVIKSYREYLAAFDLLPEIQELIGKGDLELSTLSESEKEDFKELKEFFKEALSKHTDINNNFNSLTQAQSKKYYLNPLYNTKIETLQRDLLRKEYNGLSDAEKDGRSVDEYISEMLLTRDVDDFKEDLNVSAEKIMNDPSRDISKTSSLLEDNLNTNSTTIQIINNILGEAYDKVKTLVVGKVREMDELYSRTLKEKGNLAPSKLNKNLIEVDANGQHYLYGEYSIKYKDKVESELTPLINEKERLIKEKQDEGLPDVFILSLDELQQLNNKISKWYSENTIKNEKGKRTPHPKYLNKPLTGIELERLNSYKKINEDNRKVDGFQSLIKKYQGADFHKLSSQSKSDLERRIELDVKGLTKDKLTDLTKVKSDDIGIDTESKAGEIVRQVKTHYRGKLDSKEQSLDLETMFRNEYWNGENFKSKSKLESSLTLMSEVALHKEYFKGNNTKDLVKGEFSNEYKRIVGIIERNVYDVVSHHAGFTLLGKDVNKITSFVNGWAASVAMSFNLASGTANIANGLTQVFIEAVGGNRFDVKTMLKAEGKYTKAMMDGSLLKDMTNPIKQSYFNQLLEMFDVFGGLGQNEQEAIRNSFATKFASTKMLNFINESGEHAMHSILTESILDSIKVMNADSKYIDKDGNVTTKEKAASFVDMLSMNDKGRLVMSDKVVYSSHNLVTKYHEGGKTHVNQLIKKKTFDLFGVYDIKFKSELSKAWYGKMVMMFKNFFLSSFANRFNGFTTVGVNKDNLEDDDRFYSSAEKEFIEGTYTSLGRLIIPSFRTFFKEGATPALKELQLSWQNYNNLSDYEKANIRKATTEILLTSVILPSIGMLLAAGAGDDDDAIWFAIYINRRLQQELQQFWNPLEMNRMLQNPVAGSRIVQNALTFAKDVLTPWDYLDENTKGDNILLKDGSKIVPLVPQLDINYKQRYGLQFGKIND